MPIPSPLLEALDEVGARVESARHVLLFLDFDGTLAPIVEDTQLARLPPKTRATLERLARHPACTISIVSGRALGDVRERVGIEGLVYAGNHGLEISGGGLHFEETTAESRRGDIAEAVATLNVRTVNVPGVLVEAKGLTASVHYRLVPARDRDEVERIVREVIPPDHLTLVVSPGKMVWEVRPGVAWNKGRAVRWIRERLGLRAAVTFYLGDDRTDEDAFAEVGRFVTARVGAPQPTQAGYRVADTKEVAEFLLWLSRVVRFPDPPEGYRGNQDPATGPRRSRQDTPTVRSDPAAPERRISVRSAVEGA